MTTKECYYSLLGVARNAPLSEIKSRFRIIALQLHPDVTNNDAQKAERFKKCKHAYDVLVKDRENYDKLNMAHGPRVSSSGFKERPAPRNPRAAPSSAMRNGVNFNVDEWNAWHYGDGSNVVSQPSVTQKDRYESEYKNNKHASYFARKRAAEDLKARETKRGIYDNTTSSNDNLAKAAADSLNKKREIREKTAGKSNQKDTNCSLS